MTASAGFAYDGLVYLNAARDSLDLTGDFNMQVSVTSSFPAVVGSEAIRLNADHSDKLFPGDVLIHSLTNEIIGKISKVDDEDVYFLENLSMDISNNDFVHKETKFEIAKIQILNDTTYLAVLTPAAREWPGSTDTDLQTWSASEKFAGASDNGAAYSLAGGYPQGAEIPGRFKRVVIDGTDGNNNEECLCYLIAVPSRYQTPKSWAPKRKHRFGV